jgi:uncharacterized protein (DUF2147 family)
VRTSLTILIALVMAMPVWAGSDDILGSWLNQDKDARIEIYKCGSDYCGKIVWLKEPVYPAKSSEGTPGTPKVDSKNPDASHRRAPLIGLQLIEGFQFAGGNLWKNGRIYDPDSGKTYSAKATMVSPNELDLRGFIGISLIGRTEKWTRSN